MKNLIISTINYDNQEVSNCINEIKEKFNDTEVIYTQDMNLKGCIGCNNCWLKTPGICSIKDDYDKLLIKYLEAEKVFFVAESKIGFVSYQMKNILDRTLPLATMSVKLYKGQMRHIMRYNKILKFGLIYNGTGNRDYLNTWFERVMLNFEGISLGAFEIKDEGGIINAFNNN